jgi:hypothetical protein
MDAVTASCPVVIGTSFGAGATAFG